MHRRTCQSPPPPPPLVSCTRNKPALVCSLKSSVRRICRALFSRCGGGFVSPGGRMGVTRREWGTSYMLLRNLPLFLGSFMVRASYTDSSKTRELTKKLVGRSTEVFQQQNVMFEVWLNIFTIVTLNIPPPRPPPPYLLLLHTPPPIGEQPFPSLPPTIY